MENSFDILSVSTKGQIVIPNEMRKTLSISEGDKIIAYCLNDSIVLKKLQPINKEEFIKAAEDNRKWAEEAGITEEDICNAIKRVREENK